MRIYYRKADQNDVLEQIRILKDAFYDLYIKYKDEENPYNITYEEMAGKIANPFGAYYVILGDDKVVGGIYAHPLREVLNTGDCGAYDVMYLCSLYVLPEYQNKGIAQSAIRFMEKQYPKCRKWVLDVPENETKNTHVYKKLGFIETNNKEIINKDLTIVTYEKSIKKKAIVAGHICLDITPVFPENKSGLVSEVLKPGSLIQMGAADVHTGGCVANTGLGMKILGADVSLMGKIGNDEFGDIVTGILNKYDADDGLIRVDGESTSYSVVLAMPGIDRIFLHNPGANNSFCADDVSEEPLNEASHFHFGYPPLMERMYENEGEQLLNLMKRAKSHGCSTSLDMAAIDADTAAGSIDWNRLLKKVLPYVDYFLPSAEELCFMLDRPRYENLYSQANGEEMASVIDITSDVASLVDMCFEYGAKIVVVKCGAKGMYYRSTNAKYLAGVTNDPLKWADKEGFEKSYKPDKVLSATGAGDTSIAAFLTAMLEGDSLEECIHLAAATGALCVASYDALGGLMPINMIKKRIEKGWEKNIC